MILEKKKNITLVRFIFLLLITIFMVPVMGAEESHNSSTAGNLDQNWHQFHKDVQHIGFSPSSAPSTADLLWVSDDIQAVTDSSPVVADAKIFVNTGAGNADDPTGGSGKSQIVALDINTGKIVGNYGPGSTHFGSWASPCYYNGNVSCAREDSVNGGNMVVNGKVYVGDYDGFTYHCSDEKTGKELWSFKTDGLAMGTPAYSDGKVYFPSLTQQGFGSGGNMYCVNADTGEQIWKLPTKNDTCGTPSISDNTLYFTTYVWGANQLGDLYAVNKNDGSVIWKQPIQRSDSCPAIAYGKVYVSGGCYGYSQIQTYCFDAATGQLIWSTPADWEGIGGWTNSPTVADNKVFVGKASNAFGYDEIYCLDAMTGKTLWYNRGGGASTAIVNGVVYTIGSDKKVYAYGKITPSDNGGTKPNDNGGTKPNDNGGTKPNDNGGTKPNDNGGTKPNDNGGTKPNDNGGTKPNDNKPVDTGNTTPDNTGCTTPSTSSLASGVCLKANITSSVSIEVSPGCIDFGTLSAGQISGNHQITIKNKGGKNAHMTAEVMDISKNLYVDGLKLNSQSWKSFNTDVCSGQSATVDVKLAVPSDYIGIGSMNGKVVFWAEMK